MKKKLGIYLLLILVVAGCQEKDEPVKSASTKTQASGNFVEALAEEEGEWVQKNVGNDQVNFRKVANQYVFEGDIVLTEDVVESMTSGRTKSGIGLAGVAWASGVIPYTVDADMTTDPRVLNAIAYWESNTRIDFIPRTSETNYVRFTNDFSGCYATSIGKGSGQVTINLGVGCSTGAAKHEIGHIVGLFHEHTRNDRDTYCTVLTQNIIPGRENNFAKYGASGREIGEFDFGSMMMYPSDAFTIDPFTPLYTILDKENNPFSAQADVLTDYDKYGVAVLYSYFPLNSGAQWIDGPNSYATDVFLVADFSGDGKADMAVVNPSDERAVVWKANSTGTAYISGAEWINGPFSYNGHTFLSGDANGDGKSDIIAVNAADERILVWKANASGTGFISGAEWINGPFIYNGYTFIAGDVNGDGKTDVIGVDGADQRAIVWKANATGTGFLSGAEWVNGATSYSNYTFQVGDVDGDGKDDLVGIDPADEKFVVWKANAAGTAFGTATQWINGVWSYNGWQFSVGDTNGDGKSDVVAVDQANERMLVWKANASGTAFISGSELMDGPYNYSGFLFKSGDANGDGKDDVVGLNRSQERSLVWTAK